MKTILTTAAMVAAMSTTVFAASGPIHGNFNVAERVNECVEAHADEQYPCMLILVFDANIEGVLAGREEGRAAGIEEGRGMAFGEVAEAIAAHNPNDANRFKNEGGAFIDALYGYIWHLRGQLGLN